MENKDLLARIITLELKVGFIIPEIIKELDAISNNEASKRLVKRMETTIKEIPNTVGRGDPKILTAAQQALSDIKRSLT
ncbi:hypothetical protein V3J41_002735 [Salmonella enterica]|uniref:hypothetical protein n=1 Tax=Salmonella enterica TaxID=28901 RepID=UPI0008A81C70|nr:hypothetical protein [Salmonella enterica]EBK1959242.1 hypothetical protein [Salmonella enterica subsp. enterica serovar Newport]EJS4908840.1 hypothetical protein [Salmonella enterica subsp. enterica serovar Muenchen]EKO1024307.1 hypothetical protein [Salmonella enterica subsp. enterica]MCH5484719.1 hypothetical protein [Salmonella enterica subsp. diarizonae serovar 16:z10:e,n,x,z15]WGI49125.1 hypothetical protein QBX66_21670 [Salmonella enterica subsp. diarizonae serovar 48:i:z]